MKKITIIGAGTAGVLAATHFSKWAKGYEVELCFDSNIKPQPVGEGSTLALPVTLMENIDFYHNDLNDIDGTLKTGIAKVNWGDDGAQNFEHTFPPPTVSYHFSAGKLQSYILNKLKDKIKIVDTNVTHDSIDADYVFDCSGKPENYDSFNMSEYISVNAVHVTQCFWEYPRFNSTLTIARPYGWVFGIPLKNRCSIGYLYNHNINTLEEVKEDVKNVFAEYNLEPSGTTNSFTFKNYYRKNNFLDRVIYSGNASFFLEPLEATSISAMVLIQRLAIDMWILGRSKESANNAYLYELESIETMIAMHYYAGSKFNTPFWEFAKERGERCMLSRIHNKDFMKIIEMSKMSFIEMKEGPINFSYGSWSPLSYKQNLIGLNLYDKLGALV